MQDPVAVEVKNGGECRRENEVVGETWRHHETFAESTARPHCFAARQVRRTGTVVTVELLPVMVGDGRCEVGANPPLRAALAWLIAWSTGRTCYNWPLGRGTIQVPRYSPTGNL